MATTYYDFDANWTSFLNAWYSYPVQYTLALDVECAKTLGFFKYYQSGDPLWKHTQSLYWKLRCAAAAQQLMKDEQLLTKFKRTMQGQFGLPYNPKDFFHSTCFSELVARCHPVKDTIHAFILPEFNLLFQRTMMKCAEILFPTEIIETSSDNIITVKNMRFDLFGFYNLKYG